jgi:protein gp37
VAGLSDIEWTDATWNPISGCRILSPGCTNCYAMRMASRLQAMGHAAYAGTTRKSGGRPVWTGIVHLNDAALDAPLGWRKPRRIFVNSMSDLFQDGVPDAFVRRVWAVMEGAPQHVFQILTKRPENMLRIVGENRLACLPHVWLGTSVENADYKSRIAILRKVPAQVRFISFEPLLGAIGRVNLKGIHWAIVGGESGPRARPMERRWIDEIHAQCESVGTAFFFKQWGGKNKKAAGREWRGRTWDAMPMVTSSGSVPSELRQQAP